MDRKYTREELKDFVKSLRKGKEETMEYAVKFIAGRDRIKAQVNTDRLVSVSIRTLTLMAFFITLSQMFELNKGDETKKCIMDVVEEMADLDEEGRKYMLDGAFNLMHEAGQLDGFFKGSDDDEG